MAQTLESAMELFRLIAVTCKDPKTVAAAHERAEKCAAKIRGEDQVSDKLDGFFDTVFGKMSVH